MSGGRTGSSSDPAGPELRLTVPGLALIAICYGFAWFAYGYFVPAFRTEFGIESPLIGGIGALGFLGYCAAIRGSWLLADRFGARPVTLLAGAVASLGMAFVAIAQSPASLAIGIFVTGMSAAAALPPVMLTVTLWSDAPREDRLPPLLSVGTGLGVAVVVPVGLLVADDWRLAWAGFAVLTVVATFWVWRALPRIPTERGRSRFPDDVPALADVPPRTLPLALAAGAMGVASSAVWVFGRDVVEQAAAASAAGSAWLWGMIGGAGLLTVAAGDATRRFGLRPSWTLGMVALSAATATFGLGAHRLALTFLAAVIFGAAYVVLTAAILRWGTHLSPHEPTSGLRIGLLSIVVGHMIGAALVGELLQVAEPATVFQAMASIAVLGALLRPRRLGPGQLPARPDP